MKPQDQPILKTFAVTSLGETTYTDAPSKQSILEDLQKMGCLESDTVIEEVTEDQIKNGLPTQERRVVHRPQAEAKIFTLPGGQKIKDDGGVMYALEWRAISAEDLIERLACDDIKIDGPDSTSIKDMDISILDWVKLEPEGEKEDAVEQNNDVRES